MSNDSSLLKELGLDEETLSWYQLALCGGRAGGAPMELNWFFEDYENDREFARNMDEVCLSCPVLKDCLMSAIENKDSGLRGAIYLNRGKKDKQYNSHKTEEVWSRIQEKLKSKTNPED